MAYPTFSTPNMPAYGNGGGNNNSGRRLGSFGGGRCSTQTQYPVAVGGGGGVYGKFNNKWQQQRPAWGSNSNTNCNNNYNTQPQNMSVMRPQKRCQKPPCPSGIRPGAAAPNLVKTNNECSPINVNVSADQIQNAKNCSYYPEREEVGGAPSGGNNEDLKYIPLKWDDLLGQTGLNGMRVSMLPPASGGDGGAACNPNANRQLKVSFGGQRGMPEQGETQLKVLSIEPVPSMGGKPAPAPPPACPPTPQNQAYFNNNGGMVYGGTTVSPNAAVVPPTSTTVNINRGNACNCPNCRK